MTPEDLVLIRDIVLNGRRKYTAGNIDRSRYERLVELGWLIPVIVNKTDVVYDATDQGIAAAD
ncbi:TenA/THI-4 family protein [Tardiphaga robiniae]|uniref:TenA/THI-4 family protein n=1 Tax=Tardiphaga robiniae TaxID=943830 RepID=A0A7G6U831_9BRAD|nr:TenA/THI-4 family protein [Tardiphaga robiniae]